MMMIDASASVLNRHGWQQNRRDFQPQAEFPYDRLSGVTTDQLESVGASVEDGRPLPHMIDAARPVSLFGFDFCAGLFGSAR
jgi:hypothetical protein